MTDCAEKSWKDRVPPDGHLPPSYEVQVCDEGNKVIAVQMLDKAQLKYKIAVRQGQFYISTDDMETFTKVKSVLNQTIDGAKEAAHTGIPVEVTPVGSNVTEPTPVSEGFADAWAVNIPANIYDGKYYDYRTYRFVVRDPKVKTEAQAVAWAHEHKDEIMQKADKAKISGKRYVKAPIKDNIFFTDKDGKPRKFYARLIKVAVDDEAPVTEETHGKSFWDELKGAWNAGMMKKVTQFYNDHKDDIDDDTKNDIVIHLLNNRPYQAVKVIGKYINNMDESLKEGYTTTAERKKLRERDCSQIMKDPSFKKINLNDNQLQPMRAELEGAWDAGYEEGSQEKYSVTESISTAERKRLRERDCSQIMKDPSFKKINVKGGDLQTVRAELEGAWDAGYEEGSQEKYSVTESISTAERKKLRERDCLEIMKNSSFIKKLNLNGGDIQTMCDELEGAWDAGYEEGSQEKYFVDADGNKWNGLPGGMR